MGRSQNPYAGGGVLANQLERRFSLPYYNLLMEGILSLKERLRRLEKLVSMLAQTVAGIGGSITGNGAPGSDASGLLYWDITNKNLYYNEGTLSSPVWILVS